MSDAVPVTAVAGVPPGQATEVAEGSERVAEHTTNRDTRAPRHGARVVETQDLGPGAGTA